MDMSWDDHLARYRKRLDTKVPPPYRYEVPFKVPAYLKDVKSGEYTARTVSLGLNTRLDTGKEDHKVQFHRCFMEWKNSRVTGNSKYTLERFVEDLRLDEDVPTAHRWYEIDTYRVQPITVKSFLAVDALFLILFLRCYYNNVSYARLPPEVYKELQDQTVYKLLAESRSGIWRDVFLLENQIPMHILGKVWTSMPDMENRSEPLKLFDKLLREVLKDCYLRLFQSFSDVKIVSKMLSDKSFQQCDHLLHCLHSVVCYSPPEDGKVLRVVDEKVWSPTKMIPSATQMRKVGIRIKSDTCSFIYQTKFESRFFTDSVLHIPRLYMSDETEALLRNLAVFEMVSDHSSTPRATTITSFLSLMDRLIQSQADVRLMKKDEVITSCLGSNRNTCLMWNSLCARFESYENSHWVEMLEKLTARYSNRRSQLLAEFKAKYFGKPWAVPSWVGGVILLLLTGIQTVYTILSYYRQTGKGQH